MTFRLKVGESDIKDKMNNLLTIITRTILKHRRIINLGLIASLLRKSIVYLLLFSAFTTIKAQEHKSKVVIPLENKMYISVQACSDQIFRIRISHKKVFPETLMERYGILKTDWDKVQLTSEKKKNTWILNSNGFQFIIDNKTGSIRVNDSNGKSLIEQIVYSGKHKLLVNELEESFKTYFGNTKAPFEIIGDPDYKSKLKEQADSENPDDNSILAFSLQKNERFYGGGATSRKNIQHRGEALRMWATYQKTEIPMPFLMSSNGWGIFNNTTSINYFDVGRFDKDKLFVYNTSSDIDFYLILSNSMDEIIDRYTDITLKPYLLPKWGYGLAFGGNMMEDQMEIMNNAVRFRDEKIPCDIFWLEPQWMTKYYDFSTAKNWDLKKFPAEPYWEVDNPEKYEHPLLFISKLHQLGYKLMLWLCIDNDFSIVEEDQISEKLNQPTSGQEHWFPHLTKFMDQGVDGFKLDPAHTLSEHPDRKYYNSYTDKEMHNLNQILLSKQMYNTFRNHKGIRSFHHYCGGYAGSQHWGVSTSGDNGGGKNALFDQLNLGLSGFVNTSADVMEVMSNNKNAMHLGFFLPWVQVNSWYALHHPWFLPPIEKETFRFYAQLRNSLNPYIYSAAIQGSQTGMPILRAMPLEFPEDRFADNLIYQFMFGENLLVGVFSDSIYLPKGNWINYWSGEKVSGGKTIQSNIPENRGGLLFIKSGAIIPYQTPQQYISTDFQDTLIIKVYPEGKSSYTLLEDDGISFKYEKGIIAKTLFHCEVDKSAITFRIDAGSGDYLTELANRTFLLEIFCEQPEQLSLNGSLIESEDWNYNQMEGKLIMSVKMNSVEPIELEIIK